jgi:hypothetical protein
VYLITITNNRAIDYLGLGQKFFSGWNIAIGYNLFLDFIHGQTRGGFGLELRYDWLDLSTNYSHKRLEVFQRL